MEQAGEEGNGRAGGWSWGAYFLEKLHADMAGKVAGRRTKGLERAMRTGSIRGLNWAELNAYCLWIGTEKKDLRISLRISGTDMMKLKYVAAMKGMRYQTYFRDLLKRHIRLEEDRMARPRTRRIGLGAGRRGAVGPR